MAMCASFFIFTSLPSGKYLLHVFAANICRRNEYLDYYFPPLFEELHSTRTANILSIVAPLAATACTLAALALSRLHRSTTHPWSRLRQLETSRKRLTEADFAFVKERAKERHSWPEPRGKENLPLNKARSTDLDTM